MKQIQSSFSRVVIFLTVTLSLLGLASFFVMPREEDPRIRRRNAVTTIILPGAAPEKIERTVVRPLEDELLKVEELKTVEAEIRLNVAVMKLTLRDDVTALTDAWREVEAAIERARPILPASVTKPILDFGVLDVEAVILAVSGNEDLVTLVDRAKDFKDRLMEDEDIAEVKLYGAPDLRVLVSVDSSQMHDLGISVGHLLTGVSQNTSGSSTGFIVPADKRVLIDQDNDAASVDDLSKIRFDTGRFEPVRLGNFSRIERTTVQPANSLFRWNGKPAVGLGIIPKQGLNIERFGAKVLSRLNSWKGELEPLKLEVVAFQPNRTAERIDDLLISLLSGMALIAVFLFVTAGAATAFIVTISVPVISLIGLFFYYLSGGILHQISIAAFVISIGQFIDNIIVVVDAIQTRINNGESRDSAAAAVTSQLRWPMAFATATGICAFLPMLAAQGSPADFIFALPWVAVITLIASYFVALSFTPIMARKFVGESQKSILPLPLARVEELFANIALGPLWRVSVLIAVLVGISVFAASQVTREFFPESDRNEFLFSVELNPSASMEATDGVLQAAESHFEKDPRVQSMAAFAGGDIPRFYYNLPNPSVAPQSGAILVTTQPKADLKALGLAMEQYMKSKYPEHSFTAQFLQQGPPINAKIEVQAFSPDPSRRARLLQEVREILLQDSRLRSIRTDATTGLETLRITARDQALADVGLTRDQLNQIIAFYSTGLPVSQYRHDRQIIPVVLRDTEGVKRSVTDLSQAIAYRGRMKQFTIGELAAITKTSGVPILRKENGQVFSRALADLQPSFTFDQAMTDLRKKIEKVPLAKHESIRFGGDAKGAGEANASILKVVPAAMVLLVLFLLIEFRSYRKILIATLALPVTLMGVFPGLWIGGAPFGFMSLLGILALVGIAINNIILLLEAMDSEGSLRLAIAARLRAILLTTSLTLLGLVPLAISDSSLWPPLAWTMISGLLTGTVATLIVVPALYRVLFKAAILGAALILLPLAVPPPGALAASSAGTEKSRTITLSELLEQSGGSDESQLNEIQEKISSARDSKSWRESYMPRLQIGGEWFNRDQQLEVATPFGPLVQEKRYRVDTQIQLRQPLFDPGQMFAGRRAAQLNHRAVQARKSYDNQGLRLKFAAQAIGILVMERELRFLHDSVLNLTLRKRDAIKLLSKGRVANSDLLKIEVAQNRLEHRIHELEIQLQTQRSDLGLALKLPEAWQIAPPSAPTRLADLQLTVETGDLESLRLRANALQAQKAQAISGSLPVVDGFARAISTEGRNLVDQNWTETGIGLRWELFGGGVRSAQATEIAQQKAAVEREEALLRRDKETNFADVKGRVQEGFRWLKRLAELSKSAAANRREEERRNIQGRGSLNDLVDADTLTLELSKETDVLNLSIVRDCMQLKLWAGQPVTPSCD